MVEAASGKASSAQAAATASPVERLAWLDRARGIGMVLVVLGHALVGVEWAGVATPVQLALLEMIYTFHMPLFFFLSGLSSHGMMSAQPRTFAERIGLRIVYPYILWSAVFLVIHGLGAGMTNNQSSLAQLASIHVAPVGVYWFLYALALAHLLGRALSKLGDAIVVPIAVCMIVVGVLPPMETYLYGKVSVYQTVHMIGFYLLAQRIGMARIGTWIEASWVWFTSVSALAITLAAFSFVAAANMPVVATLWSLPAAFGASFLVLALARAMPSGRLAGILAALGGSAMAIYVTHVIITGATRIGLARVFDVSDPWAIVLVGTVLGLTLPWIADQIAKRLGLAAWLGWR